MRELGLCLNVLLYNYPRGNHGEQFWIEDMYVYVALSVCLRAVGAQYAVVMVQRPTQGTAPRLHPSPDAVAIVAARYSVVRSTT